MFDKYREKINAGALEAYPNEAVWLITPGECRQVKNIATDPESTFKVDKRTMAAAIKRGLQAVVHSHPDFPDCPSAADMRGQLATVVPWGIVATNGENCTPIRWWGEGVEKAPLIGRGFVHGITDCYALIRDYYAQELGIALPEYPRNWQWHEQGENLYLDGVASAGFRRIEAEDAKPGDMWLAQFRSPVPNHGGVLLDNGLTLHHPSARNPVDPARLSRREPVGRWQHYITHWYRHSERDE
ncbi:NlpC/P60 family protein [Halomonas sp. Mc5H-6]|uniref:NlpC/P60 family protein n=1 Tax=Halomonas sp. Mc5H-6 TaxID=2954500 RepID=UPI0020984FCB|nr:NlpC/P60 family protein [Halomonas sp. Mc5H-6]MCO7246351.1 NlpC/P60 family protein [Halomonas sp. Mc5H-6]